MTTAPPLNAPMNALKNGKLVCLFGIGEQLSDCYNQLVMLLGKTPDLLCDNANEKWGKEYFGLKCISPKELGYLQKDVAVIITIRNYERVYSQLRCMGIETILVSCYERSYNRMHALKRLEENQLEGSSQKVSITSVQGKWTLITGAARGVGRQIALAMAKQGSNIIAHSRSVLHLKDLLDDCGKLGVEVVPLAAELANLNQVERMVSDLENLVPNIDIIFNNAAIPCSTDFWNVYSQEYLACYAVNAVAPIRISQRLIPPMIKRGFGRVINVTSGVQKRPETMAYACSKAALDKFVHDLAPSLQGTGVMLSLVNPGWVRTDMCTDAPHAVESVIPGVLLGALLDCDVNGRWFSAQDYAGLTIERAIQRAMFYMF
jgi:short-subunit dehydrogenase